LLGLSPGRNRRRETELEQIINKCGNFGSFNRSSTWARHRPLRAVLWAGEPRRWRWQRRHTQYIDAYPTAMEADCDSAVYRVSHVDDGAFVDLLRRNDVKHYDFATASPSRRARRADFQQQSILTNETSSNKRANRFSNTVLLKPQNRDQIGVDNLCQTDTD
jgi:hypothetical protein